MKAEKINFLSLNFIFIFYTPLVYGLPVNFSGYWHERAEIIRFEEISSFGSEILLNDDEMLVNRILMREKLHEIDEGFEDEGKFLPRSNFLTVKEKIEKSKVFKIIQKLPKGGLLHAHDVGTVSQEYILEKVTYLPNLYVCDSKGKLQLQFFDTPDEFCDWKLLSDVRKDPKSEEQINNRILHQMSMMTDNPAKSYPNGYKAWMKFQNLFYFLGSFMRYKPVFADYYYQLLKENYEDKVLYIELRVSLPKLYELNGKIYTPKEVITIIKSVVDRFVSEHPDFVGVKIIYSKQRKMSEAQMADFLRYYKVIKSLHPSFVAGLDLVGHEDKGTSLSTFANQILELGKNEDVTFFHAGETDWNGLSTDENLIDAVLLNTKRIGHGFALPKHPKVMELVKEKNIAIEVNPISNQILNLVADLRNHPASILFAENFPVVVCSDDPGLWGAKGLSYDFYEAFMGIMSRKSDLRALKKLALNSIEYSAMNGEEKLKALMIFKEQWSHFLHEIIDENNEKDVQVKMI
ncbi:adenosine deaminase 2-like [Leptopilina heterotoma]|uniref:adenosine deaminase 2-like n=1 Tax=Leptopilina heterotoma TaxID=63436 RepID=UPI001CA95B79|nr:adenosine deaminase 2-like [Leptopilina heterotoma]